MRNMFNHIYKSYFNRFLDPHPDTPYYFTQSLMVLVFDSEAPASDSNESG